MAVHMLLSSIAVLLLTAITLAAHALSAVLAWRRCRMTQVCPPGQPEIPAVSIVRPVHGLDEIEITTLASTFALDHADYEIIFCAEHESDPAVAYLRRLIAEHEHIPARLLIGTTMQSLNPKLDNVEKGWAAACHEWVIFADANVLMPPDYIHRLFAAWRPDTGLVSAPPIGSAPASFWAEIECAFLNTYQARWQYAADSIGLGFAQGKNLLWRKADLNAAGGVRALTCEVAEDAAATKLVRRSGKRVRLADCPFDQPLGARTLMQVWARQLRWAQLRRWTFPTEFTLEILTTSFVPLTAGAVAAWMLDFDVLVTVAGLLTFWLSVEALLAHAAGWHLSWRSPVAWIARDLMVVAVWFVAWRRSDYEWQGKRVVRSGQIELSTPSGVR